MQFLLIPNRINKQQIRHSVVNVILKSSVLCVRWHVGPAHEPVGPSHEPVDPADEPVDPADEPVGPSHKPFDPADEPVGPSHKPVGPSHEPVGPSHEMHQNSLRISAEGRNM